MGEEMAMARLVNGSRWLIVGVAEQHRQESSEHTIRRPVSQNACIQKFNIRILIRCTRLVGL
jgi:hypothetical protein